MKKNPLLVAGLLTLLNAAVWAQGAPAPFTVSTCPFPKGAAKLNSDPNYIEQLRTAPLDSFGQAVCAAFAKNGGNVDLCHITRAYIMNVCNGRDDGWPVSLDRFDYAMKGYEQTILNTKKPVPVAYN